MIFDQHFKENINFNNRDYNTKCGIYSEGCGLENVLISWGHDDYMYLVKFITKTILQKNYLRWIFFYKFVFT